MGWFFLIILLWGFSSENGDSPIDKDLLSLQCLYTECKKTAYLFGKMALKAPYQSKERDYLVKEALFWEQEAEMAKNLIRNYQKKEKQK